MKGRDVDRDAPQMAIVLILVGNSRWALGGSPAPHGWPMLNRV